MSDSPQVVTEEEAQAWVDWNAPDCVVGENPRALRVAFLHGYRAGSRATPTPAGHAAVAEGPCELTHKGWRVRKVSVVVPL
jgi:hypothetical protein